MRAYSLILMLVVLSCNAYAEDTRFDGQALLHFQAVGAWGWYILVDHVKDGPADMVGQNISVYMTSANPAEYPPGFIDPDIKQGDNVSVYGSLQSIEPGSYHVLLVGSQEYYIKPNYQTNTPNQSRKIIAIKNPMGTIPVSNKDQSTTSPNSIEANSIAYRFTT
jgi:hypothetical protein